MKKIISAALALLLAASLFGCLDIDTDTESKEIVPAADDPGSADGGTETDGPGSGDATSVEDETEKPDEAPVIAEQVCFENSGIKVTARSLEEDSIWGTGLRLLIENDGTKTYSVGVEQLIVNDCMMTEFFSSKVAPGKKANETLYISDSDLRNAGIDKIGKIEIYFYVYDSEEYKTVFEADCVTIRTSLYEEQKTAPDYSGYELYNENGIRIVGRYVDEDTLLGASVLLFIENRSDKDVTVSCREMSVNGFMVMPIFSATVYKDKYTVDDITILSSDLEDNGIKAVEEIALKFHISDSRSYQTVTDTPEIKFSVK